jgi:trehalose 6-phosphate phosphatase
VLEPLARDPSRAALVVDFDGTLAPIVDHPDDARALPAALDMLAALVVELALVGVVSGRPVDFLRDRIGIDGVRLVGQYGLEWLDGDDVRCDPRAEPFVDSVKAVATEAEARWPRLVVERKGRLAVALHWRTAPDAAPGTGEVEALAARHGLDVLPGRMVVELRPPLPVDKGAAVESMVLDAGVRVAAFAGDDRGDLSAFDALDRLVADDRLEAAVRVGVRSEEAPPELLARADVVVDGPAGLARLLGTLTGA